MFRRRSVGCFSRRSEPDWRLRRAYLEAIEKERATRKNSQLAMAQRVAMKMGRRLRCSSVTYPFRYAPSTASPARTALPTAHFDRNETYAYFGDRTPGGIQAMIKPVRLAVLGAGLIGKRHIQHIKAEPEAELLAIVDPAPEAKSLALDMNVRCSPSFATLVDEEKPEGVIVATPNQVHVANGLECIAAGLPTLVEKPIADDVASAAWLVEAAEAAHVPLLVGHHRRYNPLIRKAKEAVDSGRLGRVLAAHSFFWLHKPDDYFEVSWRREKGAGPVFLNLIHDVDNLRFLLGDVVSVQAYEFNAFRSNPVEETAAILLRFESGV